MIAATIDPLYNIFDEPLAGAMKASGNWAAAASVPSVDGIK
jgi:hypothetical protein